MHWLTGCSCLNRKPRESAQSSDNIYYTASRKGSADAKPKKSKTSLLLRKRFTKGPSTSTDQELEPAKVDNEDYPNPTYEVVDGNTEKRNFKSNGQIRSNSKYDYPTFCGNKPTEETFYSNASQTYSVGSEDPYSSIVSDLEPRKAPANDDNSVGYARVQDEAKPGPSTATTTRNNIDSLYAKINRNRKAFFEAPPITAPLMAVPASSQALLHAEHTFDPAGQTNESGSGSVTSSGSRNPSYKYLTVRETLGIIRERIRQREQEQLNNSGGREHYYSTITSDYETVRDEMEPILSQEDEALHPSPPTSPVPNHTPNSMVRSYPPVQYVRSQPAHTRPVIISIPRRSESAPDVKRRPHTSRIPVPISRLSRRGDHRLCNTSRAPKRKNCAPLFLPTGKDYVSMVDFGDERGWPLA